jgi:phosphoribosylformylglycinamidine synthase
MRNSNVKKIKGKYMLKANVYVTLKKEILDAQGLVIKKAISQIGYDNVNEVRFGKFIQLEINDDNQTEEEVKKEIDSLSDKLLSNPNIENYRFEIVRE